MDDVKRAEILLEISKMQMEKFNKTRSFEWKINVIAWSGIGLFALYLGKNDVAVPSFPLSIFLCILIGILHGWWVFSVQESEDKDFDIYVKCRKNLGQLMTVKENPEAFGYLDLVTSESDGNKWAFMALGTTIALLILVLVLNFNVCKELCPSCFCCTNG